MALSGRSLLKLMMSVHWVNADIALRASRSDFDPKRVRPPKPHGGGWSNLRKYYRRGPVGPGLSTKSFTFLEEKTPTSP